jgi:hypothetical protein
MYVRRDYFSDIITWKKKVHSLSGAILRGNCVSEYSKALFEVIVTE